MQYGVKLGVKLGVKAEVEMGAGRVGDQKICSTTKYRDSEPANIENKENLSLFLSLSLSLSHLHLPLSASFADGEDGENNPEDLEGVNDAPNAECPSGGRHREVEEIRQIGLIRLEHA